MGINLIAVTDWSAMALNNTGDTVSLWDSFANYSGDHQTHANAFETVNYSASGFPDPVGASIYLTNLAADNTVGSNWATSTIGGSTPLGTGYRSAALGGNIGTDIGSPGGALWIINEINADPDATAGDANGDGTVNTSQDEFVEIVNITGSAVNISGWTLSDGVGVRHTFPTNTILPDQCGVVVFAGGTPTGLFGGMTVQTASSGQLGLNNGGDTVTLNNGASDVASVAYGGEGGDNQSLTRDPDLSGSFVKHSTATGSGGALFSPGTMINGTRFAGCLDPAPTVSSTTPVNSGVALADTDISITFSEAVTASGTWADITCGSSGNHTFTDSGGPTTYVLDPDTDFTSGETCTVTVYAAQVTDDDTDDPPDNMAGDYAFSFDIVSLTLIHDIQGNGVAVTGAGPFVVDAIVVADLQETTPGAEFSGFFIQEEDGDVDADPETSEGIFVYCGSCPTDVAVGDRVQVSGGASEYNGLSELSATGAADVSVISSGNSLPTAATLNFPVAAPVSGVDYLERFEGMSVSMPGPMTITEFFNLDRYGEFLVSSGGRVYQYTQVNPPSVAGYTAFLDEFARRTITIDDGYNYQNPDPLIYPPPDFSSTNSFRGGDTVTNVSGVLHYAFGLWRIQPSDPPTVSTSFNVVNPRPAGPPNVGGSLHVASMNVLNYFNGDGLGGGFPTSRGADTLEEFNRQRAKTLAALATLNADIVGLMELENDYGDGALSAIADLVNGLNGMATGCSAWDYVDPGIAALGSDEIAVGFIYCADTVSIAPDTTPAYLNTAGIFDGLNTSRTPLAVTFSQNSTGEELTIVVNHFKSKGGTGTGDDADIGDGQGNWNASRVAAAQAELDWLATSPTGTTDSDVLLIGDLNSYLMEDPVQLLLNNGFQNMVAKYQGPFAYSYVFDGQWGSLDHVLANNSLRSQVTGAEDWHINSDEPDALDYNTDYRSPGQQASWYLPNEFRMSDHDPVLIGLDLDSTVPPPPFELTINGSAIATGSGFQWTFRTCNVGTQPTDALTFRGDADPELALQSSVPAGTIDGQTVWVGLNSLAPDSCEDTIVDATLAETAALIGSGRARLVPNPEGKADSRLSQGMVLCIFGSVADVGVNVCVDTATGAAVSDGFPTALPATGDKPVSNPIPWIIVMVLGLAGLMLFAMKWKLVR